MSMNRCSPAIRRAFGVLPGLLLLAGMVAAQARGS